MARLTSAAPAHPRRSGPEIPPALDARDRPRARSRDPGTASAERGRRSRRARAGPRTAVAARPRSSAGAGDRLDAPTEARAADSAPSPARRLHRDRPSAAWLRGSLCIVVLARARRRRPALGYRLASSTTTPAAAPTQRDAGRPSPAATPRATSPTSIPCGDNGAREHRRFAMPTAVRTRVAQRGRTTAATSATPKPGVGLVLTLTGGDRRLGTSTSTRTRGTTSRSTSPTQPADTLAGWGTRRAPKTDLSGNTKVDLSCSATGRYVLVWFTQLP